MESEVESPHYCFTGLWLLNDHTEIADIQASSSLQPHLISLVFCLCVSRDHNFYSHIPDLSSCRCGSPVSTCRIVLWRLDNSFGINPSNKTIHIWFMPPCFFNLMMGKPVLLSVRNHYSLFTWGQYGPYISGSGSFFTFSFFCCLHSSHSFSLFCHDTYTPTPYRHTVTDYWFLHEFPCPFVYSGINIPDIAYTYIHFEKRESKINKFISWLVQKITYPPSDTSQFSLGILTF